MKPLVATETLRRAAQRCVWYLSPELAVADPPRLVAHILTYGSVDDVNALRAQYDDEDLKEAVDAAPAGIFDPRSWAYWNLMLGGYTTPPAPTRRLG